MSITIVTPVLNGAANISHTLELMSRQTVPFEHLVMDAGSSDATCSIVGSYVNKYNLTLVSERDHGLYDAVQKGFARSRGDILAWLNAGDAYMPWTLSLVQQVFDEYPEIDWLTGVPAWFYRSINALSMDIVTPVYSRYAIRRGWHNGQWLSFIQQESVFWRRSLWDRSEAQKLLQGQGNGAGYATDYHLWKLFAKHAHLHTICSVLAAFSIIPGQLSEKHRTQYFKECGVSQPGKSPYRLTRNLFYLYSFCRLILPFKKLGGHRRIIPVPIV